MKLQFDPTLDYQQDAINAVIKLFDGQLTSQSNFEIGAATDTSMALSDLGIGNQIMLDDAQLLANVQAIQGANDIEKTTALQERAFSIEMETGTGKTYVYLRTIFELSRQYGLKKFIIVVPSVAVREGVLKSIEMTKDHFARLYDRVPFNSFVYDSSKLTRVRQFASGNAIQIMVINIQSFQKDIVDKDTAARSDIELRRINVINRENDKMSGQKPIAFIQATNPVVIIDEPQSVDSTDKSKRAIANLNPIVTLRYSATHRDPPNLLYKLDPIKAYDLRLVKRIEVASVRSDQNFNDAYVRLLKTDNRNGIKAQVEIHKEANGIVKLGKLSVKKGDDLFKKSGGRECYRNGYIIQNIDCTPNNSYLEFSNGERLNLGATIGGYNDEIMKAQVYETVEQHLKKECLLRSRGIKVLSLFFIDRVANYRLYNTDGTTALGKIGQWFEGSYTELTAKPHYKQFAVAAIDKIHDGYFSRDNTSKWKDSSERGHKDDEDTYHLIMRDKERLLDLAEPLRFIFSHSALREGWDNPNVFQICTLNETISTDKKRQQIGRGLRLPVNNQGARLHDETISRLTVIANESYDDFARSLQTEFETDYGICFGHIKKISFAKITRANGNGEDVPIGQAQSQAIFADLLKGGYIDAEGVIQATFDPNNPHFELKIDPQYDAIKAAIIDIIKGYLFKNRVGNAKKDRKTLKLNKQVLLNPEFQGLWDKIKHRTRYRVAFSTDDLINKAIRRIQEAEAIRIIQIDTTRVGIDLSEAGVRADRKLEEKSRQASSLTVLPDLLTYLQQETELTRQTLVKILTGSGRLSEFKFNPQQFMSMVARAICKALHDLMIAGIQYEKISDYWEMCCIQTEAEKGIVRYLNNLYQVKNQSKTLFDFVELDSEVERQFASDLDHNEQVRFFVKLPHWFKIDTPIGAYNPDWAFVTEQDQKLYFVRETKSTKDDDEMRKKEGDKIACGRQHFKTIGINYDVVTSLAETKF